MKRLSITGKYIFAAALLGFGGLQLATGHLSPAIFPFPAGLPGTVFIAWLTGLFFVAVAVCFLIDKWCRTVAMITGVLFFMLLLYPHLPKLFSNLHDPGEWVGFQETLALSCGAFILASSFGGARLQKIAIAARYLFAIVLLMFCAQHVMYESYIRTLIPAWLPATALWSYAVITGFFLTGIAVITGIKARLALTIIGCMFLCWFLILHVPLVITHATEDAQWMSMFIALAMSGICFVIAGSEEEIRTRKKYALPD